MNDLEQGWFWRMQRGEVPPPPVAALLGQSITHVDATAGELQASFMAAKNFANPAGQVQGGMLAAMLDALTASIVDATLRPGERVASLNLNVAFLRPAQPGLLQGDASLVRRGRSVANAEARLLQQGKPVATATAVCMVIPQAPDG
jgi:uncharacterized protein (TIGR00369 family)